jgi:hypothetical protein
VPVTDYAQSPLRDRRRSDLPLVAVVAVIAVAILVFVTSQLHEPDRLERLTLVNPTDYGVNVAVAPSAGAGVFELGWVWEHAERDIPDAPDVGDTWIIRFSYAGIDAGEIETTREVLAGDGWRLTIPPSVAERLAAAGVPPAYHDEGVAAAPR